MNPDEEKKDQYKWLPWDITNLEGFDSAVKTNPDGSERDQKLFQIESIATHLWWLEEHVLETLDALKEGKEGSQQTMLDELDYAQDCISQAGGHLLRLTQLIGVDSKLATYMITKNEEEKGNKP